MSLFTPEDFWFKWFLLDKILFPWAVLCIVLSLLFVSIRALILWLSGESHNSKTAGGTDTPAERRPLAHEPMAPEIFAPGLMGGAEAPPTMTDLSFFERVLEGLELAHGQVQDPRRSEGELELALHNSGKVSDRLDTIDGVVDGCSRVMPRDREVYARARQVSERASALFLRVWSRLWLALLVQWGKSKAAQRDKVERSRGEYVMRRWFFRIVGVLVLGGISALLALVVIPRRLLSFEDSRSEVTLAVVIFGLLLSIENVILFAALIFVPWPQRARVNPPVLGPGDGVALLIASYMSSPKVLARVLGSATRRLSPSCVFVCSNEPHTRANAEVREVCNRFGVNYVFIPEGNKTFSFYWTACHWLPASFRYIMMIDDDVSIPRNLEVPIRRCLARADVAAIAYTIRSAPNKDDGRGRTLWTQYQDFEYILSGYLKLLQSQAGSAVSAHGAIALWKREELLLVLEDHNTMFHGEDLNMGILLHKLSRTSKIKVIASECVETNVPSALVLNPPEGEKTLSAQRILSWDPAHHRFLAAYLEFTVLTCCWPGHTWMLHVVILSQILAILQDWARCFIVAYYIATDPVGLAEMTLRLLAVQYILLFTFNYLRLGARTDLQNPFWVVLTYPAYTLVLAGIRIIAMLYNVFFYAANVANKTKIRTRLDDRDCPPFLKGLHRVAGDFSEIWDVESVARLAGLTSEPQHASDYVAIDLGDEDEGGVPNAVDNNV